MEIMHIWEDEHGWCIVYAFEKAQDIRSQLQETPSPEGFQVVTSETEA